MNKIGGGLQYKVYKISDSRVLKLPTNRFQKIFRLLSWGCNPFLLKQKVVSAEKITEDSLNGLRQRIEAVDKAILGNPTFLKHPSYEQDFMITIGDYLKNHSLEENKIIINKYIENIIETWKYGFSDTIFNFTINHGVKSDKVVLIDLGELTFSKVEVENLIKTRSWLDRWTYRNMLNKPLKSYIAETMDLHLSLQNLEGNWLKNLED